LTIIYSSIIGNGPTRGAVPREEHRHKHSFFLTRINSFYQHPKLQYKLKIKEQSSGLDSHPACQDYFPYGATLIEIASGLTKNILNYADGCYLFPMCKPLANVTHIKLTTYYDRSN